MSSAALQPSPGDRGIWRPLALRMGEGKGELPSAWGCRAGTGEATRLPGMGGLAWSSVQHLPCPGLSPGIFNQGWFSQPCPGPRLAVPGVTEHLRPDAWGRGWDPPPPSPRARGLRRVKGPPDVGDKVPGSLIFGIWDMWVCKICVGHVDN